MSTDQLRKFSDAWCMAYRWRANQFWRKMPELHQRRMEYAWERTKAAEARYIASRDKEARK